MLKAIELGELGFESRCVGLAESLTVNIAEALAEGEHLFRTAAFRPRRGL